jgi:DUF1365 family protein
VTGSALATGRTRHRRHGPKPHEVRARLTMVLLDDDELGHPDGPDRPGGPLGGGGLWPVRYHRSDHLDADAATPLGDAVRDLVEARTGDRPLGPVRTLTQVRTFGYVFNPITVHWCLAPLTGDLPDARPVVEVVVLEVTNTPWKERHCYVVDVRPGADPALMPGPVAVGTVDRRGRVHAEVAKAMHVSPFMPMAQTYRLTCTPPGERTWLRLETFEERAHGGTERVFDADMSVRAEPLTRRSVLARLVRHPFPTHRVWAGIHAHAVVLALKRVPFFAHPDRAGASRPVIGTGPTGKVVRR